MKTSDIPALFPQAFAHAAESNTIAPIHDEKQQPGRASLKKGFPVENMTPLAAGGVPPYGQDMNGILFIKGSKDDIPNPAQAWLL